MTHRRLQEASLLLASHNAGKVAELADLLSPFGIECIGAGDLQLGEPEETGTTFIENATIKAQAAAREGKRVALGDDSGLEVDALDGAPGIFSARWAGANKDFDAAMKRILDALEQSESGARTARFVCALVLAWPDGHCEAFEGTVEGEITDRPYGDAGFGYDPIFRPLGHRCSFAEMETSQKQTLSHRAHAFDALALACLPERSRA
ncbi:MAG: RdgB/HAM1 family non-canonical purine NTP pyrophosphatase [Hyphomicrobiales bacterium]|nr:RdgB/HAM1 family non-canonical purine NTP pyrophosphatase [Hyphomicrobiales bacterium]